MFLTTGFVTMQQLEQGIDHIKASPKDQGSLELIVCRPSVGERTVLQDAVLNIEQGLLGDNWFQRDHSKLKRSIDPRDTQLNIMNARAIELIAQSKDNWKWAGDQLYVDFDLSNDNVPPGTQLQIGEAIIEVTVEPHLGCKKFMERFGREATLFVNTDLGKSLNLRGINAKVVRQGKIKVNDKIAKC